MSRQDMAGQYLGPAIAGNICLRDLANTQASNNGKRPKTGSNRHSPTIRHTRNHRNRSLGTRHSLAIRRSPVHNPFRSLRIRRNVRSLA
ncbi:MAG: hypothetical protein KGL96_09370, partial [Hyphomicrobiales bacterium]|nr:hypothetical protein [Hyphomicrobiales bacterium]